MQLRLPIFYLDQTKNDLSILHPFGDEVSATVPSGHERLGFQNAHGISRWPNPVEEVIETALKYQLGIFGIAESNCAWNEDLKMAVTAAVKQQFGNGAISCASSKLRREGYLPGGVMQMVRGSSAGRQVKSGSDKYGRYSWAEMTGKNDSKLCTITAYRVCQEKGTTPKSPDSTTAYWQQVQGMIRDGRLNPDPRTQVLTDLTTFINEKKEEGCEVILMMDANDDWEEHNSKLATFIDENVLIDVHHNMLTHLPPTTRQSSNR